MTDIQANNPKNRQGDKLDNAFGMHIDNRLANWLWIYLKSNYPNLYLGEQSNPTMRDLIAEAIIQNQNLINEIKERIPQMILPESSLEWIKHGKRQREWIKNKIKRTVGITLNAAPQSPNSRISLISKIDAWTPQKQKAIEIIEMASAWDRQKESDKAFQWFHGEEEEQKCELAWKMLIKDYQKFNIPSNQFNDHEELLIFFDSNLLNPAERTLLIKTVKSRWSQNKYRAKMTDKKQCNFILSEKAIKRLEKLAKKYDLKRTQVLEILLQMEDQKGIYIPEKIKISMDL